MTVNRTELTGRGPQPPAATGQPCPIEGVVNRTELTGWGSIGHTTGHTTGQICPRSRGSRGRGTTHRGRATGQICPVFRERGRADLPVERGGVNKNDPPPPNRPKWHPRPRRATARRSLSSHAAGNPRRHKAPEHVDPGIDP